MHEAPEKGRPGRTFKSQETWLGALVRRLGEHVALKAVGADEFLGDVGHVILEETGVRAAGKFRLQSSWATINVWPWAATVSPCAMIVKITLCRQLEDMTQGCALEKQGGRWRCGRRLTPLDQWQRPSAPGLRSEA